MARAPTSPAARLKRLDISLAKAASLGLGEVLSAKPMAELLGVSWNSLRDWCDSFEGFEASGCFQRGGNGVEWQFNAVATILWLRHHFTLERERAEGESRRLKQIVGGDALDVLPDTFDLDQVAKMIRVSTELQAAKVKAGQLIDAGNAASALRQCFSQMQQAVLRAAQEQDPTGQWPPEIRESFEDATRTILLRMEQAGEACLGQLRGGAA